MSKTQLEKTFDLPKASDFIEEVESKENEITEYNEDEMRELLDKADKIDKALPQVRELDSSDTDFDKYADKSIETFDELVDLGKSVEDKYVADVFVAASNMMANALNAKTNKIKKKLEMVKYQVQKARLDHEKEKLEYLKERYGNSKNEEPDEVTGKVRVSRNDVIHDLLKEMKKEDSEDVENSDN